MLVCMYVVCLRGNTQCNSGMKEQRCVSVTPAFGLETNSYTVGPVFETLLLGPKEPKPIINILIFFSLFKLGLDFRSED